MGWSRISILECRHGNDRAQMREWRPFQEPPFAGCRLRPGGAKLPETASRRSVRQRHAVVDQRRRPSPSRPHSAGMTPACCSARPPAGSKSFCGAPILECVSSVRSLSCLSTTASGSLVTAMKVLLHLVRIGERIFARLFVDLEHALHEIGMILEELLAHIEDAPGVGVLVAIEQLGAVLDFGRAIIGSRPAQASTSPRMSAVLPSACCSSTGVMSLSVSFTLSSARTRKMCGSVPRVTATRLPLRSSILLIARILAR